MAKSSIKRKVGKVAIFFSAIFIALGILSPGHPRGIPKEEPNHDEAIELLQRSRRRQQDETEGETEGTLEHLKNEVSEHPIDEEQHKENAVRRLIESLKSRRKQSASGGRPKK